MWEHMLMRPGNWYRGSYELIIFATNGKSKRKFGGGERDIWRIKNGAVASLINRIHPSQKPIELMAKMIENSLREGDTVLDPFMGSGTTVIACLQTGRKFIGYEIDENFFDIAVKRIEDAIAEREQSLFAEIAI